MDHSVRRKKKHHYWINSKSEQHITAQPPQSSHSCAPWGQTCTFLPAEHKKKTNQARCINISQQKAFRGSKICLAGPQEVKIYGGIKGRDGENGSGNYGISSCKHTVSWWAVAWADLSTRFTFRWLRRHSRLRGLKGSVPQRWVRWATTDAGKEGNEIDVSQRCNVAANICIRAERREAAEITTLQFSRSVRKSNR